MTPDADDPFLAWCWGRGIVLPDAQRAAFPDYVAETTGFNGQQFSLTEDERWWIFRANEVIEWLRQFATSEAPEPLDAALKCLDGLKPIPPSLTIS